MSLLVLSEEMWISLFLLSYNSALLQSLHQRVFYFSLKVLAVVVTVFNFIHFCMFQRRCVKLCTNKVANSTKEETCIQMLISNSGV